ncbi:unnamed protein product [Ixodes pacificus]
MAGDAEEVRDRRRLFHLHAYVARARPQGRVVLVHSKADVQDLPVRCEGSDECFALDVDRREEACYSCYLRSDGDDWNEGSTGAQGTGVEDAAHGRRRGDGQLEVGCSQVLHRKQFGSADNARGRVKDGIY